MLKRLLPNSSKTHPLFSEPLPSSIGCFFKPLNIIARKRNCSTVFPPAPFSTSRQVFKAFLKLYPLLSEPL